MAGLEELNTRLTTVEQKISSAVELPTVAIEVNDTVITDKTGFKVFGIKAGIHGGKYFEGISAVALPSTDADISKFIYKSL